MRKLFKRMAIAFSVYSRIPMPVFTWTKEDTGHAAAFLPLIGLIIGGLEFLAFDLFSCRTFPEAAKLAVYMLLPLLITGGFHIDGFLDTEDALQSYKSCEEKLRILKDPHIGAFAVIRFGELAVFWILGLSLLMQRADRNAALSFALIFPAVRALAGLLAQILPHARKDGMLNQETSGSLADKVLLTMEGVLCVGVIAFLNWKYFLLMAAGSILAAAAFRKQVISSFGGVTGDTIGYFLVKTETFMILLLGVCVFTGVFM